MDDGIFYVPNNLEYCVALIITNKIIPYGPTSRLYSVCFTLVFIHFATFGLDAGLDLCHPTDPRGLYFSSNGQTSFGIENAVAMLSDLRLILTIAIYNEL